MGPLSGIRIIEFQGIGPGPFCGMILSDMGADIVRIDRANRAPAEAPSEPPGDLLARGRRSIALDLKNPEGVEVALKLIEGADALFEGLPTRRDGAPRPRPRGLPRAQPEDRLWADDRLGSGRPLRADGRPTTSTTSRWPARSRRSPVRGSGPCRRSTWSATSAAAACTSPSAMLGALIEAQRSGKGQVVDAAMVGTAPPR